jgi:hypothetical protein
VYPGLYDPETAADVSPLLNAFEAAHAREIDGIAVDASPIRISNHQRVVAGLSALKSAIGSRADDAWLRETLNVISMTLLEHTVSLVEPALIRRLLRLTTERRGQFDTTDLAIDDCLRRRASRDHVDAAADGPLSFSS